LGIEAAQEVSGIVSSAVDAAVQPLGAAVVEWRERGEEGPEAVPLPLLAGQERAPVGTELEVEAQTEEVALLGEHGEEEPIGPGGEVPASIPCVRAM